MKTIFNLLHFFGIHHWVRGEDEMRNIGGWFDGIEQPYATRTCSVCKEKQYIPAHLL